MKTATSTEPEFAGGSGSRPTVAGREPGLPAAKASRFVWVLAAASIAVIVFIYFFAFRAVHEVQIRDVPLMTKGGRP